MNIYLQGGPRGGRTLEVSDRAANATSLMYKHPDPNSDEVAYYKRTENLTLDGQPIFEYEEK